MNKLLIAVIIGVFCIALGSICSTAQLDNDPDKDGLSNAEETERGTDPNNPDSDSDGLKDGVEVKGHLGFETDPLRNDTDDDGLDDLREIRWACDPKDPYTINEVYTDGELVNEKIGYPYADIGERDRDGDGLPLGAERFEIHTNSSLKSTDGDRYSDGMEWFGNQDGVDIPGYVEQNPFRPSTPDIAISVDPNVKLVLAQTVTVGSKTIKSGEHSISTEASDGFSANAGASTEVTAEAKIGWPPADSGASVTAKASVHAAIEATASSKNTEGSRQATSEEWAEAKSVDLSGSKLRTTVWLKNIGDDLLTSKMDELILNFYLGADDNPFATWSMSTDPKAPMINNLRPGWKPLPVVIEIPIGFEEYSRFDSGEALTIAVNHYSFGEDQIWLLNANSRCAIIDVDYGNGKFKRERIPVSSKGTDTLYDVYNTFGNITLSDNGKYITSIDDMKIITAGKPPHKSWSILFQDKPIEALPFNVANTTLQPGDHVLLKYLIDSNGDGISDADEKLLADKVNLTKGGTFTICAKNSGKCLGVSGGSKNDGANVIQWSCNGQWNQMFRLEPIANNPEYYRITAKHSGKCLGVSGGSKKDGANLIQWSCNGQENQMFRLEPIATDPGYYRIIAKHSGKCLDVSSGSKNDGANVIQWSSNNQDNQKFRLVPATTVQDLLKPGAQIKIRLKSWNKYYLHRPDTPTPSRVRTTSNSGIGNEWTLIVDENDRVQLKSWKGDYLDAPNGGTMAETTVNKRIGAWTLEIKENGKIRLKSWRGEYLASTGSMYGLVGLLFWSDSSKPSDPVEWEIEIISKK